MPSSLQARMTRSAISPRLAIRIFSNIRVARTSSSADSKHALDCLRTGAIEPERATWPNCTGLPFSATTSAITPLISALISFITFIASMMQTTVSSFTSFPISTKAAIRESRAIESADHGRSDFP